MIEATNNINFISQENINFCDDSIGGYHRLWKKVILQNYIDAVTQSRGRREIRYKMRAIKWFQNSDGDFEVVCSLAGLNSDYVRENIQMALKHKYWRNKKNHLL